MTIVRSDTRGVITFFKSIKTEIVTICHLYLCEFENFRKYYVGDFE